MPCSPAITRASQASHIAGSRVVAVLNICDATCGLWLGCSPLTEIPDANRPATIALRASAAVDCDRVIALQARSLGSPAPDRPTALTHRHRATHGSARPAAAETLGQASWRAPRPTGGR